MSAQIRWAGADYDSLNVNQVYLCSGAIDLAREHPIARNDI